MSSERNLRGQIAPLALILATLLFSTFRPISRLHSRGQARAGAGSSLVAFEPLDPGCGEHSGCVPLRPATLAFLPVLALVPLLVLKTRRIAMKPVMIRRLKLPPPTDPLPPLPA